MSSSIRTNLLESYQSANYHVHAASPFVLKIGQQSSKLQQLFLKFKAYQASFITAYNPASLELSVDENKKRNQSLEEKIRLLGLKYLCGVGKCDDNEWSGEESFLIFGIDQKEAIELGIKFGQNAILWIPKNTIPELLLLK